MGELLRVCGIAITAVCLGLVLREQRSKLSPYLSQIASIVIIISALSTLKPLISFIFNISSGANGSSNYVETICISGGIALVASITADICRENGENMLKTAVEYAANAQLLLLSLPLLNELLKVSRELLNL